MVFVGILWTVEAITLLTGLRPVFLGIIPRTFSGIPGIFFSLFIHADIEHLVSNSLPLLVLGSGIIFFYGSIARRVFFLIWLFTNFWVWLAARDSSHIGASGLVYGLVCFLFFSGILRKDSRLLAVSLLVTFLYGSMVWGILPVDQSISWESHLFGSVAGIFCAIYFRHYGPPQAKPQWEIDEENEKLSDGQPLGMDFPTDPNNDAPEITIRYDYKENPPGQSTGDEPKN